RGMRRWNVAENARARILDDNELRAVWKAAEDSDAFGALIRLALLTAQRRDKVWSMRWADISEDGVWTIPAASAREKGTAGKVKLPQMALDIIRAQPRIGDNPHVFPGRYGKTHASDYCRQKSVLDAKLKGTGAEIAPWVLHDLRRTARSL